MEATMPDPVRIGLSISTRINAPADTLPTYRGFLLAMEKVAQAADLPVAVEWSMLDDGGDPDRSRALAEEAAADPSYVGIVGPMGSTEAFANAPVFDEAGLLQVSPCASHPDLCHQGYRTFFRLVPNEKVQGTELARIARTYLGAQRAAIVHDADAFGTSVADNLSAGYLELGGEIAVRESFKQGPDEYGALADAIAAAQPDVVFFAVHSHEGVLVSKEIRDRGITAPFLGTDGLKTSFFLGGGEPNAEAYHTHSGADFSRMPTAAEFRDEYVSRFPADSTYSPEAYDSAMLVAEALRRAEEPTREGVLAAFRTIESYDGITGTVRFSEIGERLDAPVSFYRVEMADGQRVMVYQGVTTDIA
jgi:branched-chain amino acid transport system substrate-binding protein